MKTCKKKIDEMNKIGNNRQLYKNVNWIRKGFQPRVNTYKRKDGSITYNGEEITEKWKEHFN